jgi:hypothetical protein
MIAAGLLMARKRSTGGLINAVGEFANRDRRDLVA